LALAGAASLAAFLCVPQVHAAPGVRVADIGGGRVEVEVHDVSVSQVIDALKASHLIAFEGLNAPSRLVTGTYTGTLPQVLSRVLDGYNYFLRVTPSGAQLYIVDAAGIDARARSSVAAIPIVPNAAIAPRAGQPVSSNVDLDEERAEEGLAANRAVKTVAPRSLPAHPAPPTGTANQPASTRISTNVDLDEGTSQ
jgi:hypothetical protein